MNCNIKNRIYFEVLRLLYLLWLLLCLFLAFVCVCVLDGRRGCLFSHALDSAHNGQILKEHRLEHLSRAELCTLLLQSDDRLLPQVSGNRHR